MTYLWDYRCYICLEYSLFNFFQFVRLSFVNDCFFISLNSPDCSVIIEILCPFLQWSLKPTFWIYFRRKDCFLGFNVAYVAEVMDLPVIFISPPGPMHSITSIVGNPFQPSSSPVLGVEFTNPSFIRNIIFQTWVINSFIHPVIKS